jgi:hypothetical protein
MRIRACLAGRNLEPEWIAASIGSVLSQSYRKVTLDFTDDASEDYGESIILANRAMRAYTSMAEEFEARHLIRRNEVRMGGLFNLWRAANRAHDDDVVFLMGADDWIEPGALERVAELYRDPDVWMTYGTFKNSDGSETHKSFRWTGHDIRDLLHDFLWMPLTCRAWLLKKVLVEDLQVGGFFAPSSGDIFLNAPIAEMAGPDHAHWIEERWYTRRCHARNDTRIDAALQYFMAFKAWGKKRYHRLETRDSPVIREDHQLQFGMCFHPDGRGNVITPQMIQYGDELPIVHGREELLTVADLPPWVAEEAKRSLACPTCQGKALCLCHERAK